MKRTQPSWKCGTCAASAASARSSRASGPVSARVEIVYVTPEVAMGWLAKKLPSRPLNAERVAAFARDMASGEWPLSAPDIVLSDEGLLLDGVHRLEAVVAAGVEVRMFVLFDVPYRAPTVRGHA